jgi:hypothetical protein
MVLFVQSVVLEGLCNYQHNIPSKNTGYLHPGNSWRKSVVGNMVVCNCFFNLSFEQKEGRVRFWLVSCGNDEESPSSIW